MRVLVACEFTQIVTKAFRERGHEAYSCDILPTEGNPDWHIQGDVLDYLDGMPSMSVDGGRDFKWDMMIAFPPCTFLTVSGNKWMKPEFEKRFPTRKQDRKYAVQFFMDLYNAPIPKIAVENPVGIMSTVFRKPDQIIQPYYFGDPVPKSTCLWLKKLPCLIHFDEDTLIHKKTHVTPEYVIGKRDGKKYSLIHYMSVGNGNRAKIRSKTFPGIAKAMAEQWG